MTKNDDGESMFYIFQLRNILTAAFDDDLSDEEEEEDGTGDSQSNTSHEDRHPTPNPEERSVQGQLKYNTGLVDTTNSEIVSYCKFTFRLPN